jgi:2-C-methyl-D-erythritol 4-phosphate cytidylyltransferase
MEHCSAIIVAAGSSRRAGFDKLMARLGGRLVLQRSLDVFLASPRVDEVVLVCPQERFDQLDLQQAGAKRVVRVDGGSERHFSVAAGLGALSDGAQYVAIHDGARPLLHPKQLERCIAALSEHPAVASAHPIVDTLKRADDNGRTLGHGVDRSHLWAMETPQIFDLTMLRRAYDKVMSSGSLVTDEVSAMETIGCSTYLVRNPYPNNKITLPEDIAIAEALLPLSVGE